MDYKYVDESADIAQGYTLGEGSNASPSPPLVPESEAPTNDRRDSKLSIDHRSLAESSILGDPVGSYSSEHCVLPPNQPEGSHSPGYPSYPMQLSPRHQRNHSSISSASPHFSHSSQASPGTRDLVSHIDHGFDHGLPYLNEHEACLMRYFVEQLAPWVCDLTSNLRLSLD